MKREAKTWLPLPQVLLLCGGTSSGARHLPLAQPPDSAAPPHLVVPSAARQAAMWVATLLKLSFSSSIIRTTNSLQEIPPVRRSQKSEGLSLVDAD